METHEIFEHLASRYDTEDRIALAKINTAALREELTDTEDKHALDYGCGTGLIGLNLAPLFASMLLVDASEQMVEQTQYKIDQMQLSHAHTLCCDFCVDVPSGISADVIIASLVLLHVKDVQKLLERFYEVLHPGGTLLIVDFDKNECIVSDKVHNGFIQSELQQLLRSIGFSSAHSHTFYEGRRLFMKQDASLFVLSAIK